MHTHTYVCLLPCALEMTFGGDYVHGDKTDEDQHPLQIVYIYSYCPQVVFSQLTGAQSALQPVSFESNSSLVTVFS